jgi:hypothetical protein
VVYGGDDIEFEFAIRGCLEHARIDLDLLDTGAVELLERCDDACLLPSARGPIDEEMWEITALSLRKVLSEVFTFCKAGLVRLQELSDAQKALDGS